MTMNFRYTNEFQKDFKKLSKKYKTLDNDLFEFKKILNESPLGIGKHFNVLTKHNDINIVKARFFCQSLKKKDLRIIYAYTETQAIVEIIYFKGDKENEDRERIEMYLKNLPDQE
jgi:mRNA-degrading endonuclease RelE of RelBE toxin-antitoxin system